MSDAVRRLREDVVERAVRGSAMATEPVRRAAFDNRDVDARARGLIEKVARHAWKVSDADVAATKAAGFSEDEIFELTICAALGQATRQLDAALAALNKAEERGKR